MIKFLGVGFQRSGTTWLYNQLKSNPEVYMPPKKEIHYFDRDYLYSNSDLKNSYLISRIFTIRWYKTLRRDILKCLIDRNYKDLGFYLKWHFSNYNDDWYLNLFKKNYVSGEITPSYSVLNHEQLISIKNIAPDIKIVFILRNPIYRSWSQFRYFQKFHDKLKNISESEIIEFLNQKKVTDRSDYKETLKRYYKVFPAKNILITFYDSILINPDELINDINNFIGISPNNSISSNKIYNSSPKIPIPKSVYDFLKNQYKKQIEYLANNIGEYSKSWKENLNESNFESTTKFSSSKILENGLND